MSQLIWKNGKNIGISLDDEEKSLAIFAGNAAIYLDEEKGQVVISGLVTENHSGERIEDMILRRSAGPETLIPSTTVSPMPAATLHVPFAAVGGLMSDTWGMITKLLGG